MGNKDPGSHKITAYVLWIEASGCPPAWGSGWRALRHFHKGGSRDPEPSQESWDAHARFLGPNLLL